MEKENIYDVLMIKVLEGNASKTEIEQFQNWLQKAPANKKEYVDFQKIWNATPAISFLEKLDIEADLVAVKNKAIEPRKIRKPRIIQLSMIRRIAAILLPLVVMATALFFYFNQQNTKDPILLSDGTKVWLYQDAALDYPATFAADIRSVKLTGEAFFDVAKDATKPFIIQAGATDIRVLGTSFNVQSQAIATKVIVNTGKVQLINRAVPENLIELTKGEKGIFEKGILAETINKDKNYRSWQTGIFEFDGTIPIDEVVRKLSKYYGVIELNTTVNQACLLDAKFEQEELSTVLEVIRNSCGLE